MNPPTDHDASRTEQIGSGRMFRFLEVLVTRKIQFVKVFAISAVLLYAFIFFFIEEQYEASALIIPREEDVTASAGSLLRGIKNLPFGIGQKPAGYEMDLYNTIIYSRGVMEDVIGHFALLDAYGLDTARLDMETAVKRLRKAVLTAETEESAFQVTVRARTPVMAADMTNYVVQRMNAKIVELKFSRSRDNRIFLEHRIDEVQANLKAAEDSLQRFQEQTGFLDAKVQVQGILTAHAAIERDLTVQKFKKSILERMYDSQSPEVQEADMQIQEYQKNLDVLRSKSDPGSSLLPLSKLPQRSVEFLRRYRAVEINNMLLEYVLPLFEQAKFEEKKDFPVLQVIDYAVPPAKKSYPPRTVFALLGALSVTLLAAIGTFLRDEGKNITDTRLLSLYREAKHWTRKRGTQER